MNTSDSNQLSLATTSIFGQPPSYACNALGIETELQTPHCKYLALGKTKEERLSNYRALFAVHVDKQLLLEIRSSVNSGLALGSERFTQQVEASTKQRVTPRKAGRPKKKSDDDS